MGIIKTAMLSGVGLYAVNKIAKTAEHRHDNHPPSSNNSRTSQPQYIDAGDGQGYSYVTASGREQGQQRSSTPIRGRPQSQQMQFDDHYSTQQQGQPTYLLTDNHHSPPPYGYSRDAEYTYETDPRAIPQRVYAGTPVPQQQNYYVPRQQQSGFVEADEFSDWDSQSQADRSGGGKTALLNTLAQQVMGMGGRDDKGNGGKGKDLIGKFLSK